MRARQPERPTAIGRRAGPKPASRLADCLEGVGNDPNSLLGQASATVRWSGVQRAKRWTSSAWTARAEGGENVGERALPARQQRLDHLRSGSAPRSSRRRRSGAARARRGGRFRSRRPPPEPARRGLLPSGRGASPRRSRRAGPAVRSAPAPIKYSSMPRYWHGRVPTGWRTTRDGEKERDASGLLFHRSYEQCEGQAQHGIPTWGLD